MWSLHACDKRVYWGRDTTTTTSDKEPNHCKFIVRDN
jgi:hypothetical protein